MTPPDHAPSQITVHALQIGDRINTAGFEGEILSSTPLAVRVGEYGMAVVFRYGAVVFLGLTADQEAEFLERLHARCAGKISPYEEEWTKVQIAREGGEPIPVGGPVLVQDMSLERLLVVSDALAKSVVLGHDEREVANVFDTIEPFARELAVQGLDPFREFIFVFQPRIEPLEIGPVPQHVRLLADGDAARQAMLHQ